jgi:hypothetical protein
MSTDDYIAVWLSALRSKRYKQGRRSLSRNGRFCVLGVLCDVLELPYVKVCENGSRYYFGWHDVLPKQAQESVGLNTVKGDFCGGCLTQLNDSGMSFEELADFIESKPLGLFKD